MARRMTGALACVLTVASLLVLGGAARADAAPAASGADVRVASASVEVSATQVAVRVRRRVAWVVVDVPRLDAGRVRMDVRTPADALGQRRTWQWCEIDYVGPGRYRCGVDVRDRTGARDLLGLWEATAALDTATVGTVPFALT